MSVRSANLTFGALGIGDTLVSALRELGVVTPTPVQQQAIPALLAGSDAIVQAQTGTGKTLAFVLPMLQRIRPDELFSQALIITPTRELAIQIYGEVAKLAPALGIAALPVYGGQDVIAQAHRLQGGAQVIVGTPGRLNDHLRRGTINLDKLHILVLDEADQMLALGFLDEVTGVIDAAPGERQTLLFSATMPEPVRRLAASYLRSPADIRVHGREITLDTIRQTLIETTDRAKQSTLLQLLRRYRPHLAVIFCRTKIRAKKLAEALLSHGLSVEELHGDLTQARREEVMAAFRRGDIQLLVATDVAARGLDVEGVTHVINYDIPHDAESYIHRIGRTGRAGHKGYAFTLAAPRDAMYVQLIEKGIGMTLERQSDSQYKDEVRPRPDRQTDVRGRGDRLLVKASMVKRGESGRKPGDSNRGRGERGPRADSPKAQTFGRNSRHTSGTKPTGRRERRK
ncbi:DEAD/DEAH box helicase [Paenibacillus chartarius]|uniref:DEAD/DEAH box helicase n=1 Tax=Paenibacillus chartarius TaxID=747481 RepID=A0ABV6DVG2_9BACL